MLVSSPAQAVPRSIEPQALLEASNIHKSFGAVAVLQDVRLTVRAGRLNALLGENGAGKSTLMNILAGALSPDSGTIRLGGSHVSFRSTREAQQAGVSIIFQELNLIPEMSVAENIYLGREPVTRFGTVDFARMNRDAAKLLADLEAAFSPETRVGSLSIGSQQVVEIAKALSFGPRVLIMDEPTSAITKHEIDVLFRQIRRLKAAGTGIVYITHKLDELVHIADDLTILRDGKLIAAMPFAGTTRDQIVSMMVGRDLSDLYPKSLSQAGAPLMEVRDLSLWSRVAGGRSPSRYRLKDVSLDLRRGEVVGVFGLMGAGRTELLEAIFGLHSNSVSGEILIDGQPIVSRSVADAMKAGIAMVPEDRKRDGGVLGLSVAHNLTLACTNRIERYGFLRVSRERSLVEAYRQKLNVKLRSQDQPLGHLSGGNQQKVIISKWLATDPRILLLDEPTRGIDMGAKREIYAAINKLAQDGLGILLVTSELPELLGLADRIVVLAEGRVTGRFTRADATEEEILSAAIPAGERKQ